MKKTKKILQNIVIIILVIVVIISGYQVVSFILQNHNDQKPVDDLNKKLEKTSEKDKNQDAGFDLSREAWEALKAENSEIVAYIAFPDGFVKEPVAQAPVNNPDKYLRHWIDGSYNHAGTVFIEGDNSLDDQNITMYGHSNDMYTNVKFSPFTLLVDQKEYEKHHNFTVWYDDRIATYEIVAMQEYDTAIDHPGFEFNQANFLNQGDFDNYMNYVRQHNIIDSHGDAENIPKNTRFVTIQTCKRFEPRYHYILTCKQTSERSWDK